MKKSEFIKVNMAALEAAAEPAQEAEAMPMEGAVQGMADMPIRLSSEEWQGAFDEIKKRIEELT